MKTLGAAALIAGGLALVRYPSRWSHRPPSAPMGRFGGGWQWNVGVQIGARTVIVNCLVGHLRFDRKRRGR